jgi:hypothetical protein
MIYAGSIPKVESKNQLVLPRFDNGHWHFPEQMGGKAYAGFIYVIRDTVLNRFYLGKKSYFGAGKLNKGVESNWRKYMSSSNLLKEMFAERPKEEFDFIVLEQYKTKGTLSYSETWSLCLVEAPTSDLWYNHLVEKVSWRVKEPISERHKDRLQRIRAFEQFKERL